MLRFRRLLCQWGLILALSCAGVTPLHALNRAALVAQSTALQDQWYYLEWFGYYQIEGSPGAASGEILHNEHGRLFVHDNSHAHAGSDYWIVDDYSMNATWRLRQADYPNVIWRFMPPPANGHILAYLVGSAPTREFFNTTTGATEYHPVTPAYSPSGPHGPVPVWWKQMGLVDLTKSSDHFSPLLVGQLKHVATGAKNYLDSRFGLTSQDWNNAYSAFGATNPFPFDQTATGSNYAPATIGQLKFVASGFYKILADFAPGYEVNQRLLELGFPSANLRNQPPHLPWTGDGASPANKTVANLGQLKMAFSFDLDRGLYLGQTWVPMVAMSAMVPPSVGTIPPRPAASTFTIVDYSVDTWGQFFASERSTANQSWFRSHWFGYMWTSSTSSFLSLAGHSPGWAWHDEHLWMHFPERLTGDAQYLWDDSGIEWLWVNAAWSSGYQKMRWFYSYQLQSWVYYVSRFDSDGRWFWADNPPREEHWFWISDLGDADGDGISDFWEYQLGLDIFDPNDAFMDGNGDFFSAWVELLIRPRSLPYNTSSSASDWDTPWHLDHALGDLSGNDFAIITPQGTIYRVGSDRKLSPVSF